jgi:hypothetical protein
VWAAVLASLLPYGRKRNYGLMTTFLETVRALLGVVGSGRSA